jgi:rfaE bifunctional protein kinase chain/domain
MGLKRNLDRGRKEDEAKRLSEIVRRFRGRRVAVLADLVSDEFIFGDIERISREAPVLILRHRKTVVVPGGGGNAIANLRALGARPVPVGVVGGDGAGRRLLAEFKRLRIPTAGILVHAAHETPSKCRVLAGGVHTRRQQLVRIDRGGDSSVLPRTLKTRLRKKLSDALDGAEGLLVADYGYGAATPELVSGVSGRLKRQAVPLLVDSRTRVAQFSGVTACTPNQEEVERAMSLSPLEATVDLHAAGRRLLRRTGNRAVLVTRGSRGMTLFEPRRKPLDVPAFGSDEVADVTGAGDTVIAAFTLATIAGADFSDAARLSNYAAGLVVMKMGTATLSPRELLQAIREHLPESAADADPVRSGDTMSRR